MKQWAIARAVGAVPERHPQNLEVMAQGAVPGGDIRCHSNFVW
ncbi:hypothetical protein [Halomicronema sp. CCY15110]|nr:hypothetical protein [Halomicronema sp. CCY15110]